VMLHQHTLPGKVCTRYSRVYQVVSVPSLSTRMISDMIVHTTR